MVHDVLVLGGSGFIGSRLCEMLVERNGGVAGPFSVATRHVQRARHLLVLPDLDVLEADVHDDAQLARLLAGRECVVNLVGILHGSEAEFDHVHAQLPRRLSALGAAAGVQRIVHLSALGASDDAPSMYLRSKAAGEHALNDGAVPAWVLRPSVVFGAHDRFLHTFARLSGRSPVLPLPCADAKFQPVWVDDLCRAVIACVQAAPASPRLYECAGPEVFTLEELVRKAAQWAGHDPQIVHVGEGAARLQAWLMEHLPGEPLMSRDNLASMKVDAVASGTLPGLAELGIRATPLQAVMPQWFADPGWREHELDGFRQARA